MNKTKNPSAFPMWTGHMSNKDTSTGMSLRDYFAGKALGCMDLPHDGEYSQSDRENQGPKTDAKWIATSAYRLADAMLEERNK